MKRRNFIKNNTLMMGGLMVRLRFLLDQNCFQEWRNLYRTGPIWLIALLPAKPLKS